MEKTVKIACVGVGTAPLDEFLDFQGELKTLPAHEYEALRNQIIKQGYSFCVHVWQSEGKLWLMDGHQRVHTLKRMRADGWTIPELPYSTVQAETHNEAKLKLLAGAAQYGKVNEIGLANFLRGIEIEPEILAADFPLPGVNMAKFIEVHLPKIEDIGDMASAGSFPVPGSAGDISVTPVSQVKMVQMFFSLQNHAEFIHMSDVLRKKFSTTNLTDTVLAAVRSAYEGS